MIFFEIRRPLWNLKIPYRFGSKIAAALDAAAAAPASAAAAAVAAAAAAAAAGAADQQVPGSNPGVPFV